MSHVFAAPWKMMIAWCWIALLGGSAASAKIARPGIPVEGVADPVPVISDHLIPREALIEMDRLELGKNFRQEDAAKLVMAGALLEDYFAASAAADRKHAVKGLEETGLAPGIIGRLSRLRLRWPALAGGVYYVNQKRGPYQLRYFLGVPAQYDRSKPWPLVIRLAPPLPFMTNPPPDAQRVTKFYNAWIADELKIHPDALVLMPLLDLGELYGPSYSGMNSVIRPLLDAADRVNVDPARVYLMGYSTGGHATWNLALHYPTYFAAIAPLAGGASADWQRVRLGNLRNVLPVVWADADDKVVKPESSRGVVKALKNLKYDVNYVETRGLGHMLSEAVEHERYQVMRSRVRELYPRKVTLDSNRPDVAFNRNDWIQVWQADDPGKETQLLFRRGTGHMTITEHAAKVEAVRDGNTIELTLTNVESMRLCLNDQMFDLTRPLTIVINKKKTIHGGAKQSIEQMLNDQLILGRGWRYYTAFLDIDLADPSATRPSATQSATIQAATNPSQFPASRPALRKGHITVGPGAAGD